MARPTIMKICLVIALTIAAGESYAATSYTATKLTNATAVGAASFTPSNNVTVGVMSSASAYSANAKHLNGDRVIAFTSTDSRLYYSSASSLVGATVDAPSAADTYTACSATPATWNSL